MLDRFKSLVIELDWLRACLIPQDEVVLNCDSASAICLANNQVYHARTKHIDIRYHKIRELVDSHEVKLEKIHTLQNLADVLTKVLPKGRHSQCVTLRLKEVSCDATQYVRIKVEFVRSCDPHIRLKKCSS